MITFYTRFSIIIVLISATFLFFCFNSVIDLSLNKISLIIDFGTLILLILFILKTNYRWFALFKAKKVLGFKLNPKSWHQLLSEEAIHWILFALISIMIFFWYDLGNKFGTLLLVFILEGIIYIFYGKKHYKIIINNNTITLISNKVFIVHWSRITKLTLRHNDIQLIQKDSKIDLLNLDLLDNSNKQKLLDKIKKIAITRNIFIFE